jgi:uncharacterized RDD family membrane protein YckC
MTSPAPGWYPDPHVPQQMRWWDGRAWTDDTYERTIPLDAGLGTPSGTEHATGSQVQRGTPAEGLRRSTVGAGTLAVTDDGVPLAGWGRRAVARLLDGIVISMLALLVAFPATSDVLDILRRELSESLQAAQNGTNPSSTVLVNPQLVQAAGVISLARLLVSLAYDLLFLLWRQATPGKLLLGLRVRRWTPGERLSPTVVVRRWLSSEAAWTIPQVGTVYNLVDVLWPLRDARRQALHDKFAGTCVVRPQR